MERNAREDIEKVLDPFKPISLEEMKAVRLMNRVDQKYITSLKALPLLLERIADAYYVQRIDGEALADYNTLYFDTASLEMYTQHHNKKLTRKKVRIRTYMSSKELTTFFEIKNKNNKKKTKKIRIEVDRNIFNQALSDESVSTFLKENTPYHAAMLTEQVENDFSRITLVDNGFNERVTIDNGITFNNRATGLKFDMSNLVILEVKHEVGAPTSPIEMALKEMRIKPQRISKYCMGTVFTNPNCRYNRFKQKARNIDWLTEGQCHQQVDWIEGLGR